MYNFFITGYPGSGKTTIFNDITENDKLEEYKVGIVERVF